MEPLRVSSRLELPVAELSLRFSHSGGPGGQNVNKVETRVELRFDLVGSKTLTEVQRERLQERLAARITRSGELIVRADKHRERGRNMEEARQRLAKLIASALEVARPRKATKPTRGSQRRRLESKRQRSETKRRRQGPSPDQD